MSSLLEWTRHAVHRSSLAVAAVEHVFRRSDSSGDIFPTDHDRGLVDGPAFDRVLVIGEGTAVGFGVRTHQLGMAAQVARNMNRRSGRGVHWSVAGYHNFRLRDGPDLIHSLTNLPNIDVIVLMVGISDTLRMTTTRAWERSLVLTLKALEGRIPRDAKIVIAAIPPMDNAGSISKVARLAAGRQGVRFDRISRAVATTRAGCSVAEFPAELGLELWRPESQESPYVNMYEVWSTSISDSIAGMANARI